MRRMPGLAVAVLLSALSLGACSPDEPADDDLTGDTSSPPADEDDGTAGDDTSAADDDTSPADGDGETDGASAGEVDALELTVCEADDLTVEYPRSWTAYAGDDAPPCRVFHPEPIEDFQGESLHYAVRLHIDPVDFEEATESSEGEELSREETTVDGHEAVITERRSEGGALVPEGERTYAYTVDLDGRILVASTTTVGDTDYERDRRVLDRMMETLTIDVEA